MNAVGLNFYVAQYRDSSGGQIKSNPLCSIGSDPTLWSSYNPHTTPTPAYPFDYHWIWGWHQVAHPNGQSQVYDACAAQWTDLSGAAYQNPPINWALTAFWFTSPGNYDSGNSGRGLTLAPLIGLGPPSPVLQATPILDAK